MTPADVAEITGRLERLWGDIDPTVWAGVLAPCEYDYAVRTFADLRDVLQRKPTVDEFTARYHQTDPATRTRMTDDERSSGLAHVAALRAQLKNRAVSA